MRRRGRSGAPGAGAAPGGDPRADRLELRRHLAEQGLDERGGVRRPERQEAGDPDKILERLCGGAEGLAAGDVVCAGDERVEPVELVADVGFGSDRAHLVLLGQGGCLHARLARQGVQVQRRSLRKIRWFRALLCAMVLHPACVLRPRQGFCAPARI